MDWDQLAEKLDDEQARLERMLDLIRAEHESMESVKWGSVETFDELVEGDPRHVVSGASNEWLTRNAPLGYVLGRQMEFNRTVMSMLTDLDHRKVEREG